MRLLQRSASPRVPGHRPHSAYRIAICPGKEAAQEQRLLLVLFVPLGIRHKGHKDHEGRQAGVRQVPNYIGFSQFTIQGMPNLSVNIPKRLAQNVSAIGIATVPSFDNAAKMRSAFSGVSTPMFT
jgi:hypothetical protein